jgi:hypothetical protein
MLLLQHSEMSLTVLSQMSIVVQISAFVFSLAHSGMNCSRGRLLTAFRFRR